jgi:hypothetical protein
MASARQIVANQRNAKKSTGPKSDAGRKRSGKNAYRHGLSVPMSTVEYGAQLKDLARQFGGDSADVESLALAERGAHAHLELERIRRDQNAMIERGLTLGISRAELFVPEELRQRFVRTDGPGAMRGESSLRPEPLPGGKEEEGRKFVEAVRRVLPDLTKTCRYEKLAAGRRDRALSKLVSIKSQTRRIATAPSRSNAKPNT